MALNRCDFPSDAIALVAVWADQYDLLISIEPFEGYMKTTLVLTFVADMKFSTDLFFDHLFHV